MTTRQRTGLLAFGIVGGLFLGAAAVVAVVANVSGDKGTWRDLVDRPMSSGSTDDDESYIRGHRWWKKQISKSQLDRIAETIISTDHGRTVLVTDSGLAEPWDLPIDQMPPRLKGASRRLYIACEWGARPTRKQVIQAIRQELDREEYSGR
jgi:hypothetical protein